MGAGEIFANWFFGVAQLGGVVVAIAVAIFLRKKFFEKIEPHWDDAVIPSIAFLLTHLTVWWMWPQYWTPFYMSNGFMMLQIAGVFGLYGMSLSNKPAKAVGKALTYIAGLGLLLNAWEVYKTTHPTQPPPPPPTITVKVGSGYWRNHVTDSNREIAMKVNKFFLDETSAFEADLMSQIAFEESSFRQFEEDGTTPLRGTVNPEDTGVFQINKNKWSEDLAMLGEDFSPDTLDGSLNMALWIYRKEGADTWLTYTKAMYVLGRGIQRPSDDTRITRVSVQPEKPKAEVCKNTKITAPVEGWTHFDTKDKRVALNIFGPILLDDGKGGIRRLDVHDNYDVTWKSDYIEIQAMSLRYDGAPNPTPSVVIVRVCSA